MKRALLVGVGSYANEALPTLDSPASDLKDWARLLRDPTLGAFDDVRDLLDADSYRLQLTLYDFLTSAEPHDFLLVYYSGHGRLHHDHRLYLTATDTDPDRLPPTSVPTDEFRHWVDECRAHELVLILDCCHAGAFGDLKQRGDRSRIVVVSAGATELAHEGDGHKQHALPSAFSGPFLEGLRTGGADRDGNGIISVREAFEYAAVRMIDRERRQTPQMRAAGVGDLILSNAPRRPQLIPEELLALTRSRLAVARVLAVDELSNWAYGHQRSRDQLVAAFETLETLERDPAERVAERARQALSGRLRVTRAEVAEDPGPPEPAGEPGWAAGSTFYEVNVRFFYDSDGDGHGDLRGVTEKLDYLRRLGVDCLLLNPIMAAPALGDGRAAADFEAIDEGLGAPSHLLELLSLAHRQGLRVVLDLVLNHTSDQHPWFQASRDDPSGPYGDFYVWSDSGEGYAEADDPLGSHGAGWTYDSQRRQYYWHRYSRSEPDLNYDAPEVRAAMRDVMAFWLRQGVDGLRLLTVPYLFERSGTSSKGLDETHGYLRQLRSWLDSAYPDRILIAWSEDWPEGAGAYFGTAEHPECHLVMYASLMPSLLLAMRREAHRPVSRVLAQMGDQPPDRHWAVFLRNGDEMSLGLLHERERDDLLQAYAPLARMRGATGIRRRTATLLNDDRGQLELAFALLLSMPGVPVLYYGDEIGMGENLALPGHLAFNTPMQWAPDRNGGFSVAQPENLPAPPIHESIYGYMAVNVENQLRSRSSLLHVVEKLIETRHACPAFSRPGCRIVRSTNPAVLAFLRGEPDDEVLCLFNFSRYPQTTTLSLASHVGCRPRELTGGAEFPGVPNSGEYDLGVAGHGVFWLSVAAGHDPDTGVNPPGTAARR
ncbi:alpha-glucosidase C-terminal domain-containing protein [Micromonospora sp. C51]|uniref:caspase, EACC1-associated type n=1 Tax=Micromonospora sp. C51 TaxID=2824879 RepID=UPI001B35AC3C|nr:alpha-amylase family glycosyl hydrolase [Micromonospora sp. C51]MBQ1047060.1 alpha-glucosidase C-terminal domain-containing protein [Micromonospora sp. C51]